MAVEIVVRGRNEASGALREAADGVRDVGTASEDSAKQTTGLFDALGSLGAGTAIAGIAAVGTALFEISAEASNARTALQGLDNVDMSQVLSDASLLEARYGTDMQSVLGATRTLMSEFGMSSQEAMDLVIAGFEGGLDTSGDFLDSIGEYSNLMAENGFAADEFFSVMQSGLAGGALGTDKITDAFKEFGIRMLEMPEDIWDRLTLDLDMTAQEATALLDGMSNGTVSVADAYGQLMPRLAGIDDQVRQNSIGVALFGTQWEDMGASAILGVDIAATSMDDITATAENGRQTFASLGEILPRMWGEFTVALLPANDALLGFVNGAMTGEGAAGTLLTALQPVTTFFQANWQPILAGAAAVLGVVLVAAGASAVGAMAGVIAVAAPVIAILAAVGVAGAALYGAWQSNFGGIQTATDSAMTAIQSVITAALGVVTAFWAENGASILATAQTTWLQIQQIIGTVVTIISTVVSTVFGVIASFLSTHGDTIQTVLGTTWSLIQTSIETTLGVIQGVVNTVLSVIEGDWDGAMNNLLSVAETIISGVQEQFDTLKTFVTEVGPEFMTAAGAVGQAIIDGIADAIKGGASAIADAARSAAQAALDAAKRLLGIQSPSKVFARTVGLPIAQGMAIGIRDGMPLVSDSAASLARGATQAAQQSAQQSVVVNQTIHQAPGERFDQFSDRTLGGLRTAVSMVR